MNNTHRTNTTNEIVAAARRRGRHLLGVAALGAVAVGASACYQEDIAEEIRSEAITQNQAVAEEASTTTPSAPTEAETVKATVEVASGIQIDDKSDNTTKSDDKPDTTVADNTSKSDNKAQPATTAKTEQSAKAKQPAKTEQPAKTKQSAKTEATVPNAPVLDLSGTGEGENIYVDDQGALRNAGTDAPICPEPMPANGLDANGDYILDDPAFGLPLCDTDGNFITIPKKDSVIISSDAEEYVDQEGVLRDAETGEPVPNAPVLDLSGTGEGENVYVDDFGTQRNAGNDEPVCPQPLPADGRDAHGDYILLDGRTGLPMCDGNGDFITIPGDHEDFETN